MANATPTRLGQINQAGDTDALFLKVFAGEVLTAFEQHNFMLEKHSVRTIQHGKSASFPVTGRVSSSYHTPGDELLGKKMNQNEIVVTIDPLLVSDVFVASIDEAKNHFDVRSILSTECGRQLAKQMQIAVMKEAVKGARATKLVDDGYGGSVIEDDNFKIDAAGAADIIEKYKALASALFTAAQTLDEKDAPDQRYAVLRPAEYYALAQNTDAINKLFGGAGAYADGKILKVAGIDILKSNDVPKTDTSGTDTYHGVNATKTIGLVWTPEALGTVKLMDLKTEMEYDIRRQGTLIVAKYACGHKYLRPDCLIELALDALSN